MEAAGRSLAGSRPAFPRGPTLTPLHQAGALQGPHAAGCHLRGRTSSRGQPHGGEQQGPALARERERS